MHPCAYKKEEGKESEDYRKSINKLIDKHNTDNLTILNQYLDILHKYSLY